MSNLLSKEKSPYLLQHADNPVDWHPWNEETLGRARGENKPLFLSVGYATCHWCHVMAHESFEDEEVAEALRTYFISIKVDREERPDVDQVYMAACQALTGQGGWPLSVFLTPEGKPFYAGTYFPKTSRYGRPGFMDIVTQLGEKWITHEEVVRKAADQLTQALADQDTGTGVELGPDTLQLGFEQLSRSFDSHWGGFGKAPKFPTPHNYGFLLRHARRTKNGDARHIVEQSLTALRRGGIFDHVGLGFHRYSVDEKWLVPHFEKMLYDQALLAIAYVEAYQVTGKEIFSKAAREIATYVLRDMTSPEGGFYAAEDADSEGREGLFYVWNMQETESVLGKEDADLFCKYYGFTPEGNFEDGLNIPHIRRPLSLAAKEFGLSDEEMKARLKSCLDRLYDHREKRIHPLKDDKIITAWNGMMIAALAKAGGALDEPEYIAKASAAVDFILAELVDQNGRLLRRHREGESAVPAFLEDYACLAWGLIDLYEAGFDIAHLEKAIELTREMIRRFWDEKDGGLFFTGEGNETLVTRKKEVYDGAVPSGNSVAALNLARLARMTGDDDFDQKARAILDAFSGQAGAYPAAHTHLLMALDFLIGPSSEAVIVGDPEHENTRTMIREVRKKFRPNTVVMYKGGGDEDGRLAALAPFTRDMTAETEPSFYLCRNFTCQRPLKNLAEIRKILDA